MQETQEGAHKNHNTHDCCHFNKDGTMIKKDGSASKPTSKKDEMVQALPKLSNRSLRKQSVQPLSSHTIIRNIIQITWTATMTLSTVLEVMGWIALGIYILVRKLS